MLPLVVPIQVLVGLTQGEVQNSSGGNGQLILDYIRSRHVPTEFTALLTEAFHARWLIIILDGIDEASGLREAMEDLMLKELVPNGFRVVVTSRPEGIRPKMYVDKFVIMNLKPLDDDQQRAIVAAQLRDDEFFGHLLAFHAIRKQHDCIWLSNAFQSEAARRKIENTSAPDRFKLPDGSFDPQMRQVALSSGESRRFVEKRERGVSILSNYLTALNQDLRHLLPSLETLLAEMSAEVSDGEIEERVKSILGGPKTCLHTVAIRLTKYAQKLKRTGDTEVPVSELWSTIVAHTDELYIVAEELYPAFQKIMPALIKASGMKPGALKMATFKDPVRVYEKGIGDYGTRFNDGVIPQACITDILRSLCLAKNGESMVRVFELLLQDEGFQIDMGEDGVAELTLLRFKNKCSPKDLDPTHFRNALFNLRLKHRGTEMFVPPISQTHLADRFSFL